jgi:hypothetical protein
MRLLETLERLCAAEESLFRRQLLTEDLARLRRVQVLAREAQDRHGFIEAGMLVGWTQGNARTQELREPLRELLEAIYAFEHSQRDDTQEARIAECWESLHRTRMQKLLGCLSTPVPRPEG